VGVPRSGMIPAYMIGLILNVPVIDIEGFISGIVPHVGKRLEYKKNEIRKVLVVDDSIKFGGQLKEVKQKLNSLDSIHFKFLSVFASTDSKEMVDYCLEIIDKPRVFQWNLLNSWIYEYSCVDIDGVLCEDPTEDQNDDAEAYMNFLKNAKPKYIPSCHIGVLVTNRLEKYRLPTEEWLNKNNIKYNSLIMLDLPDKKTRVKLGIHSNFKSEIYKSHINHLLFIESNINQAIEINRNTGRNVFCVENMTFYPDFNQSNKQSSFYYFTFLNKIASKIKKFFTL
jgi:uncharacterized HAD superfamily protein